MLGGGDVVMELGGRSEVEEDGGESDVTEVRMVDEGMQTVVEEERSVEERVCEMKRQLVMLESDVVDRMRERRRMHELDPLSRRLLHSTPVTRGMQRSEDVVSIKTRKRKNRNEI